MKLQKIRAKNIKGLSFELELAEILFLIGSNFVGKSARTDAIRLLLIGYLPELGKLNSATFGLCSGRELLVEGEFDDGSVIRRRWFLKGDSVKSEQEIPEKIAACGTLLQMLDAESYFGLSERDRIAYVAANIEAPAGTEDLVAKTIAALSGTLNAVADIDGKSVFRVIAGIERRLEERNRSDDFSHEPWTPQSLTLFLISAADEEKKIARDQAVRMEKTVQGLAQLRLRDEPIPDVSAMEARRVEIVAEIARLNGVAATAKARVDANRNNATLRAQLARELAGKGAHDIQKADAERNLEVVRAELAALPEVGQGEIDEQASAGNAAGVALAGHEADLRTVNSSIERNERELAEIDAKTACPYCGAAGEGWKSTKDKEINSALAGLRTKRDQLVEHCARIRQDRDRADARFKSLRATKNTRDAVGREIADIERTIAGLAIQAATLKGKEERLAAIPPEDPNVTTEAEMTRTALNLNQYALNAVDQDIRAATSRAGELQRLAQAETDRDQSKVDEGTAKAAAETLREMQGRLVAEAFSPLLTIANGIFGSILKTPLAYNPSLAEIGRWEGGAWVGHKTFSGVEKLVAYAAIQAALASRSPVRLMILDEMLRAHRKVFAKIDLAVRTAVKAGVIDQFIGILPCDASDVPNLATEDGTCKVIEVA